MISDKTSFIFGDKCIYKNIYCTFLDDKNNKCNIFNKKLYVNNNSTEPLKCEICKSVIHFINN